MVPYRRNGLSTRDVFDLFDDFFNDRKSTMVRDFRIDVKDEKDKYVVEAEVPGLEKKDISIKFENDRLTIAIQQEQHNEDNDEQDKYIHRERHLFSSERSILLEDVDPKKMQASMNNGILTIELKKLADKVSSYLIDIK
jgi:HSP20 family protein